MIDFGGGMVWNCDNTGRIPDVIYHETGHNFHFRSLIDTGTIPADINAFFGGDIPSLSEGLADTLSTAITHDAQLGPGFFIGDPNGLRNLNPDGIEKVYPQDVTFEPHNDGEIIGDAPGHRAADRMFEGIVSHSTVFTSTYADALAADDDDGNLANGTPHQCELSRAFGLHGLAPAGLAGGVAIGTPSVDAGAFVVPIAVPAVDCPGLGVTAVNVTWRSRADTAQTGTVPLAANGATWTAALPVVPDGTVLQYQVAITFSDSSTATRPLNTADPYYEAYVGAVTTIRCDDFETDPGWTHAATTGTDEWQRAAGGTAPAAGDPTAAASAATILGTDVTDNGLYAASSDTYAETPAVDTTGYATVRLQYKRWLDVDDGFYDRAAISAGGTALWSNPAGTDAASATSVFHDGEWRFHDVDLTAAAAAGSVQVRYALTTDAAGAYGGWNLDDVCVVGIGAVCGDTLMRGTEQCDDGNVEDGDGCSAICAIEPPDMGGGCCQTGTDPRGTLVITAFAILGLVIVLRRRRR
jgi:cysteine-rich repeat protein